jgi:hypothetical protein
MLLEEAYEAAERLKRSHDAGALEINEDNDDMAETARRDLDRISTRAVSLLLLGTPTEQRRTSVSMSPGRRSGGLLILKRRNVNGAQTSHRKRSLQVLLRERYGLQNDKAS